jgi:thioredoxin-like negative regulator of GroEL
VKNICTTGKENTPCWAQISCVPMINIHSQTQLDTLKQEKEAILMLFGGTNCGVCQAIKPQIEANFSDKFPTLAMVYIDCECTQEICAQHGVFSLPVVQIFFTGQKVG